MLRQALIIIDSLAGIFQLLPIVESLRFRQLRILIQLIFILLLLFYAKTIFAIGICTQPEMACGVPVMEHEV
uniref:Uncharacterized protein n=1 Tax=Wuchereria bancrofti TaxID=6293 RepID=A0AAF5RX36_WUCBA